MKKKNTSGKVAKTRTKKTLKNTAGFIESNKKELLILAGVVVAGVVGYSIVSSMRNSLDGALEPLNETVDVDVIIDTSKVTITKEQSQQFAKTLLDACNYAYPFYGTDEEAIKDVFLKLKTADDFKLVYEAFGMKNYNGYNSPPSSFLRHLDSYAPRDLVYWLRSELSSSDVAYKIVKQRVESAGFVF